MQVRGLHRKMDEHSRKMDRVLRLLEPRSAPSLRKRVLCLPHAVSLPIMHGVTS